eukprot:scaffold144905_cov16-Prasinocladus_malaysianus.AAC.1
MAADNPLLAASRLCLWSVFRCASDNGARTEVFVAVSLARATIAAVSIALTVSQSIGTVTHQLHAESLSLLSQKHAIRDGQSGRRSCHMCGG